jgi:hypothetical protein
LVLTVAAAAVVVVLGSSAAAAPPLQLHANSSRNARASAGVAGGQALEAMTETE